MISLYKGKVLCIKYSPHKHVSAALHKIGKLSKNVTNVKVNLSHNFHPTLYNQNALGRIIQKKTVLQN